VEAIPADMVARHEFEIDTTRAVEAWEAEVAANLAARQATLAPDGAASPP
jgi:3-ketosteroid 9alpha-monooxygenase subunit A